VPLLAGINGFPVCRFTLLAVNHFSRKVICEQCCLHREAKVLNGKQWHTRLALADSFSIAEAVS